MSSDGPRTDPEIACTLGHDDAMAQLGEWEALVVSAQSVERRDGHLCVTLPISKQGQVEDLATRERACCSFLDISVVADDSAQTVTVTVTSPEPAADAVVSFIGRPVTGGGSR